MEQEKKYVAGWVIWLLVLLIPVALVFTALKYTGIIGTTVVERVVFEQSYQKQAGDAARLNAYRAQLAKINSLLVTNPNDPDLQAQKTMLEIQINGAP